MKKINNNDKINLIKSRIERKNEEVKEMTSWLNEWKDSKDMTNILKNDIRKVKFEIKMLELELKAINVKDNFMDKVTA